jgi:hypothetical protein
LTTTEFSWLQKRQEKVVARGSLYIAKSVGFPNYDHDEVYLSGPLGFAA